MIKANSCYKMYKTVMFLTISLLLLLALYSLKNACSGTWKKFHYQTILWKGKFQKSAKINVSNSLYELKKAVNLLYSLMSQWT